MVFVAAMNCVNNNFSKLDNNYEMFSTVPFYKLYSKLNLEGKVFWLLSKFLVLNFKSGFTFDLLLILYAQFICIYAKTCIIFNQESHRKFSNQNHITMLSFNLNSSNIRFWIFHIFITLANALDRSIFLKWCTCLTGIWSCSGTRPLWTSPVITTSECWIGWRSSPK